MPRCRKESLRDELAAFANHGKRKDLSKTEVTQMLPPHVKILIGEDLASFVSSTFSYSLFPCFASFTLGPQSAAQLSLFKVVPPFPSVPGLLIGSLERALYLNLFHLHDGRNVCSFHLVSTWDSRGSQQPMWDWHVAKNKYLCPLWLCLHGLNFRMTQAWLVYTRYEGGCSEPQ